MGCYEPRPVWTSRTSWSVRPTLSVTGPSAYKVAGRVDCWKKADRYAFGTQSPVKFPPGSFSWHPGLRPETKAPYGRPRLAVRKAKICTA